MKKIKIFDICIIAIFTAIIMLMAFIPYLGYISFIPGIASFTLIHIPVLIGAILLGPKKGLLLGIIFGISSFLIAFIRPATPADYIFQNPLVSILPRAIFGFVICYIYKCLNHIIKKDKISLALTLGLSTFIHTMMVLPLMYLFRGDHLGDLEGGIFKFVFGALTISSLMEIVMAIVIGLPVIISLKKGLNEKLENSIY